MKLQKLAILISLGTVWLAGCNMNSEEEKEQLPNILMVVADDLGKELGCYGDMNALTPALDQFADQYTIFKNAYVTTASCSPSRSSMLTGLYPHQNGQVGLSHRGFGMYEEFLTIPTALKARGYQTGVIGKIHVLPLKAFNFDYKYGGFDYPYQGQADPYYSKTVEKVTEDWQKVNEKVKFTRMVHLVADSAANFIDRRNGRPFFLMVNLLDPHEPFYQQVAGEPETPVKGDSLRHLAFTGWEGDDRKDRLAAYYNGGQRIDIGFRRLINILEERDLLENTMIIFLGDHGAPLNRAKLTNFEAGIGIPLLVKFPHQKQPAEYERYVSTIDLLPTILDLIGSEIPEDLPGYSWLGIEDQHEPWREAIFTEFQWHTRDIFFPRRAIRQGQYKLIANPAAKWYSEYLDELPKGSRFKAYAENPEYELYDLEIDPYEFENRFNDPGYQEISRELIVNLKEWQEKTNDPLLNQDSLLVYKNQVKQIIATSKMSKN